MAFDLNYLSSSAPTMQSQRMQNPNQNYNPINSFQPEGSGGFWEWLFGSPERLQQIQRFSPEQRQALRQMLEKGKLGAEGLQNQYLQQYYQGQNSFEPMAEQARSQFNRYTAPSIAERFTQLGGQGTSPASENAFMDRAKTDLELGLNAQRAQYGQNQQRINLANLGQQQSLVERLLGHGLENQFENVYRPQNYGLVGETIKSLASGAGKAAGAYFGGGF
jgi:hypothetical protein